MAGTAPVYHALSDKMVQWLHSMQVFGRQIYKHLMNGVSHMLPFVVGGGILIALAFLFDVFDPANPKTLVPVRLLRPSNAIGGASLVHDTRIVGYIAIVLRTVQVL